jgi:hypothetical protein
MAGTVHIPWYATGFRANKLAEALAEIAPLSLRYGASYYEVHRSRDDLYKFLQITSFEDKVDWERYWYGPEFSSWRARYSSFYQVPVLYVWNDTVIAGSRGEAPHSESAASLAGDTI